MTELFEIDEEEWVEISDDEGRKAALRHLAMVRDGKKTYHILGAFTPRDDGDGESGLLLVREDETADGAQEYVLTSDESEVERVIGGFVMHTLALYAASEEEDEDEGRADEDEQEDGPALCACGAYHRPGELCVCDDPDMLQ